jgi:predicted GNAT family acetyltransferase
MSAPTASSPDIQHQEQEGRGTFFIEGPEGRAAELSYERAPDGRSATLLHTEVSRSLRGQGVAQKLVEAAAAWARTQKVSLVPQCPFARAVFDKQAALKDVLAQAS